jgi:predicted DNA-binding transcriptional regulator AlpA
MTASRKREQAPAQPECINEMAAGPDVAPVSGAEPVGFFNERQVAAVLGMSVLTLQKWRYLRKGPKYRKIGGKAVRYSVGEFQKWLAANFEGGEDVDLRGFSMQDRRAR